MPNLSRSPWPRLRAALSFVVVLLAASVLGSRDLYAEVCSKVPGVVVMCPVSDLATTYVSGALVGPEHFVRAANPKDWPATFYFQAPTGWCTATAVGPRVVATAAHCLFSLSQNVLFVLGNDPTQQHTATCRRHAKYRDADNITEPKARAAASFDFAICETVNDLSLSRYESIDSRDLQSVTAQTGKVRIVGFGCVKFESGKKPSPNYADIEVQVFPDKDSFAELGSASSAGLCAGDSGGAAYVLTTAKGLGRRVVGVNARGDANKLANPGPSLISTWGTPEGRAFLQEYLSAGSRICGANLHDTSKCNFE